MRRELYAALQCYEINASLRVSTGHVECYLSRMLFIFQLKEFMYVGILMS